MMPFTYARPSGADEASRLRAAENARYLGGGTNLVDLLCETIEHPSSLVDVVGLSSAIEETADGGVGEIGITGVAAAVANATGERFRELPITVDKLLARWM